jgi:hypothetical protein
MDKVVITYTRSEAIDSIITDMSKTWTEDDKDQCDIDTLLELLYECDLKFLNDWVNEMSLNPQVIYKLREEGG